MWFLECHLWVPMYLHGTIIWVQMSIYLHLRKTKEQKNNIGVFSKNQIKTAFLAYCMHLNVMNIFIKKTLFYMMHLKEKHIELNDEKKLNYYFSYFILLVPKTGTHFWNNILKTYLVTPQDIIDADGYTTLG